MAEKKNRRALVQLNVRLYSTLRVPGCFRPSVPDLSMAQLFVGGGSCRRIVGFPPKVGKVTASRQRVGMIWAEHPQAIAEQVLKSCDGIGVMPCLPAPVRDAATGFQ